MGEELEEKNAERKKSDNEEDEKIIQTNDESVNKSTLDTFNVPTINKQNISVTINNYDSGKTVNLYGDNLNAVFAESIRDSNIQGRGETKSSNTQTENTIDQPHSDVDFELYVNKYKNTKIFFTLIAVASLTKVEEVNLEYVCDTLKKELDAVTRFSDGEDILYDAFDSRVHLFHYAFLTRTKINRNTHAGWIPINCVCFLDESFSSRVRSWIWLLYPQLRDAILIWLLKLSKTDKRFLCAMAQNGIAEYATLDFEYALNQIFPYFNKKCNESEIATLSNILQSFYEKSVHIENIENMLLNWFGYENNDLWIVGLRLCAKGYAIRCQERMKSVLSKHIFDVNLRKNKDYIYILNFAHRSEFISDQFIGVLDDKFSHSNYLAEKDETANIFIWFMIFDLLILDDNYPAILFAQCANEKTFRRKMRPILHYIMSKYSLRKQMYDVLEAFVIKYQQFCSDWSKIERFFIEIAFTGKKEDFDKTIEWLHHCQKDEREYDFSKNIQNLLKNTLNQNKGKE